MKYLKKIKEYKKYIILIIVSLALIFFTVRFDTPNTSEKKVNKSKQQQKETISIPEKPSLGEIGESIDDFLEEMDMLKREIKTEDSLLDVSAVLENTSQELSCVFKDRGYCVPGYISSDTWWTPAPRLSYGKAVWYDPYLMEATAEWRGMDLKGFVGGVAMMSPADIGEVIWIKRENRQVWDGPFLVVDVSSRHDMYVTVEKIGEVVEIDYQTAVTWGMIEDTGSRGYIIESYMEYVEVYKGLYPPQLPTFNVISYVEHFRENLTWGSGVYRSWSVDDIKIANYAEYRYALSVFLNISGLNK